MTALTISQLAEHVGASAHTIRYYHRIGLLPDPVRNAAGYRLYGEEDIGRLRFIRNAQRFGLRLDEIAELVTIRDQGQCPCGHTRRLLERRLQDLEHQLDELQQLRNDVRRLLQDLPASDDAWHCNTPVVSITPRPEGTP